MIFIRPKKGAYQRHTPVSDSKITAAFCRRVPLGRQEKGPTRRATAAYLDGEASRLFFWSFISTASFFTKCWASVKLPSVAER